MLKIFKNKFTTKILTNSLAVGFPMSAISFLDPEGTFLGYTQSDVPIVLNTHTIDSDRNSHSSVIFGMNGKGKTMLVSKLITDKILNKNNKTIIIDPKRDYFNLVNNYGGIYVEMSGLAKDSYCFNPLEVFIKIYSDGSHPLLMHFRFLSDFFRILFPEISLVQANILDNAIRNAYLSKNINYETNFTTLKTTDYPILEDLKTFILEQKSKDKENDCLILTSFLNNYIDKGNYSSIWNKHSKLPINESNLICFDIQKLITSSSNDNNLANAQLFLMLKWMYAIIVENKDQNDASKNNKSNFIPNWVDIFVDEGHVLTTHKNKTPLHFLFTMFKTIRGFNGGVHFITQNIIGLMGNSETKELTTGMLDNAQYMFIFGLAPNDIKNLDILFETIGGLTDSEKEFLSTAQSGECIFAPFSHLRFIIKVDITEIEIAFFKTKLDLNNLQLFYPSENENKNGTNLDEK